MHAVILADRHFSKDWNLASSQHPFIVCASWWLLLSHGVKALSIAASHASAFPRLLTVSLWNLRPPAVPVALRRGRCGGSLRKGARCAKGRIRKGFPIREDLQEHCQSSPSRRGSFSSRPASLGGLTCQQMRLVLTSCCHEEAHDGPHARNHEVWHCL